MSELTEQEQKIVIDKLLLEWKRLGCDSQKDFAQIIGISPGFLNLILSGQRLGIRSLKKIAYRLKRPIDYFLTSGTGEDLQPLLKSKPLNETLLAEIMEKSFKLINTKKIKLSPDQLSILFANLYQHYADTGEPISEFEINKYLMLIPASSNK
jgi:transcriptional regulator with XRE-family HTH domain